jgi:succinate dehydrogenase / fumarate reductase iron-sulfur subunit
MTVTDERPEIAEHLTTVTIKIRRFDPEIDPEANWQSFDVPVEKGDRLLDALHHIKWYLDGSLTFRRS